MLNYVVDPKLLASRVPAGTELDQFDGRTFISLVGFRFLSTKVFGVPVPFHGNFEEVNLRFYVRRREAGVLKRGVVFIQELVPRRAIAAVARFAYHENYRRLPMTHRIEASGTGVKVRYAWRLGAQWNSLAVDATGEPQGMAEGSEEQFIAEHYGWGGRQSSAASGRHRKSKVRHDPLVETRTADRRLRKHFEMSRGSGSGAVHFLGGCLCFLRSLHGYLLAADLARTADRIAPGMLARD